MSNKNKYPSPPIEIITLDWIDKQREKHQISDYRLSLLIGQDRSYLGSIRNGKKGMNKGVKSAIWYLFKLIENNML